MATAELAIEIEAGDPAEPTVASPARYELLTGHVAKVLRAMRAESVHVCVTDGEEIGHGRI